MSGGLKVLTSLPNEEWLLARRSSDKVFDRERERLGWVAGSQCGPRSEWSERRSLGLRGAGGCFGWSESATVTLEYADIVSSGFCSI
jgi:hypothetical protein